MVRRPVGAPPHHQSKGDQGDSDKKDEQRSLFEPGDERHGNREENAGDAKLPGSQAQSGDEDAEGEQRQENAPQGVAGDQAANLADVDQIHSGEDGRPLAELNRYRLEPPATQWQVAPT